MINSINVARFILIILFAGYQVWAFKNKKSIFLKLLPIVIAMALGILTIVLVPFIGVIAYYIIFFILIIELSLIGIMLVIISEIFLALFSGGRNLKRAAALSVVFIILTFVYYLVEKVI